MLLQPLTRKAALLLMNLTLLSTLGLPALAQSTPTSSPLQDFKAEDPNDPAKAFTNRGGASSLVNLFQRLQQVNSRSDLEFAEDQTKSFNQAVDDFRQKQKQQLGSIQPQGTVSPAIESSAPLSN